MENDPGSPGRNSEVTSQRSPDPEELTDAETGLAHFADGRLSHKQRIGGPWRVERQGHRLSLRAKPTLRH